MSLVCIMSCLTTCNEMLRYICADVGYIIQKHWPSMDTVDTLNIGLSNYAVSLN